MQQRFFTGCRFALFGVVILTLVLLYFVNPATPSRFPGCPFHTLTGFHCPGCGTLRAIHCLLHGELFAALRLNPLMLLSLPFLAWMLLEKSGRDGRLSWKALPSFPDKITRAIPCIIIIYFILRNIPILPFTFLAPS